ncbi:MAG TPA: ribonuclease III [Clostridia bacterium]|nr:ribonuclease III [Clostridia bacterium]
MIPSPLHILETSIGHQFMRRDLLERALTHSSHARESETPSSGGAVSERHGDNEQLEFLGDAVLGFVVSQELFGRFPDYNEGELSKMKAYLVSARHLVRAARRIELGKYLRLGRGEEKSGGRAKNALLVDALEALLAALFLDAGIDMAHSFIVREIVDPELHALEKHGEQVLAVTDDKSRLLEMTQALGRPQPSYVVVNEEGPEHRKTFTVEARIYPREGVEPEFIGRGEGSTKKKAEQGAAKQALRYLVVLDQGQRALQQDLQEEKTKAK